MKKIIVFILAALLAVAMAGCNMGLGLGNFEFTGVHCSDFSGNCRDFTVTKWYEDDTGIEVKTKEAGSIFCSEGTYILYEGNKCPICNP